MTMNFNNFNFDEDKSIRNKYVKIEHVCVLAAQIFLIWFYIDNNNNNNPLLFMLLFKGVEML